MFSAGRSSKHPLNSGALAADESGRQLPHRSAGRYHPRFVVARPADPRAVREGSEPTSSVGRFLPPGTIYRMLRIRSRSSRALRPSDPPGTVYELERLGRRFFDGSLAALRRNSLFAQMFGVAGGLFGFLVLFAGSAFAKPWALRAGVVLVFASLLLLVLYFLSIFALECLPSFASSLWRAVTIQTGYILAGGVRQLRPSISAGQGSIPRRMLRHVRSLDLSVTERDSFTKLTEEWNGTVTDLASAVRVL